MAFRLLPRARLGGSVPGSSSSSTAAAAGAASAAAAAAAAFSLGRPSTANCDAPPPASERLHIVQLESSWEDLFPIEDAAKRAAFPVEGQSETPVAAALERGNKVAADKEAKSFPAPGNFGGRGADVVTFSLAPPSADECERALASVESMLLERSGGSVASSQGSWSEASATMEASERALIRYKAVMEEGDSWQGTGVCPGGSLPASAMGTSSMWQGADEDSGAEVPRGLRMLPRAPHMLDSSMSSTSSSRVLGTGHAGAGMEMWGSSAAMRAQMAQVLDKHGDKVTKILGKPAVWGAIMNDEDFLEILKDEQATVINRQQPQPSAYGEDLPKHAEQPRNDYGNNGFWSFFTRVQEKIEGVVASMKSYLLGQPKQEKAKKVLEEDEDEGSAGSWGVLGGILAVVVAVAVVVLLQRGRR